MSSGASGSNDGMSLAETRAAKKSVVAKVFIVVFVTYFLLKKIIIDNSAP